jgi:type III secretory pathway component EscS
MSDTYRFCVKAIAVEAAALTLCGWLAGLVYGSWKVVIASQCLFMACEWIGFRIEAYLHRRRSVEGARWSQE